MVLPVPYRIVLASLLLGAGPAFAADEPVRQTTETVKPAPAPSATPPAPAVDITRPTPRELDAEALKHLAAEPRPGEVRWLDAADARYLALVLPATTRQELGSVILLPDTGETPDEPSLITPLREALAGLGWTTWSLALVPAPTATAAKPPADSDWRPGLERALAEIRQSGNGNIFLIAHGDTGLGLLNQTAPLPTVTGLILLDVRAHDDTATQALATTLSQLRLPAFDILAAGRDENTALAQRRSAGERAKDGNYRQLALSGTDRHLNGYTGFVAHAIHGWARRQTTLAQEKPDDQTSPTTPPNP